MRIVADTNTVVSGLFWQGPPRQLIDAARRQAVVLCTSPILLAELADVMARPKFAPRLRKAGLDAQTLFQDFARLAEIVQTPVLLKPVCRDPDDDHVLACAIASNAELIVSGDQDLLSLQQHQGIAILTATRTCQRIAP